MREQTADLTDVITTAASIVTLTMCWATARRPRCLTDKQQRLYHYTQTSELYSIDDSLKGESRYRYDPIGCLKAASTPLGQESFAFDSAGNLIDPELPQNAEQHRDSQPINLNGM